MIKATGNIVVTRRANPLGLEQYEYGWQGGDVTILNWYHAREEPGLRHRDFPAAGETFWLGPFKLRVLDSDFCSLEVWVRRDGWLSWGLAKLYIVGRHLERVYRKLVITAAVWGLARYDGYTVPTWRDVYLLERVAKWVREVVNGAAKA